MSNNMDDTATNRNHAQYYRSGMYCTLSIHEVRLTFCDSYEGYRVRNRNSRRRSRGAIQSFRKASHISQRQSRGNNTCGCSKNATSYQEHHNQISPLPEFHHKRRCTLLSVIGRRGEVLWGVFRKTILCHLSFKASCQSHNRLETEKGGKTTDQIFRGGVPKIPNGISHLGLPSIRPRISPTGRANRAT